MNCEKRTRKLALVGCLLFVAMVLSACSTQPNDSIPWPTEGMAELIPEMNHVCEKVNESDKQLSIYASDGITRSEFGDYINRCADMGYTIDKNVSGDSFQAYNQDGYHISLHYYTSRQNSPYLFTLILDIPKADGKLTWPKYGLAEKLPLPEKEKGNIDDDSSDSFLAYVGEVDEEEFKQYVDDCLAAGFNLEYRRGDAYFDAKNDQGDELSVKYIGFKTMMIWLRASEVEKSGNSGFSYAESSNTSSSSKTGETNSSSSASTSASSASKTSSGKSKSTNSNSFKNSDAKKYSEAEEAAKQYYYDSSGHIHKK